MPTPAKNIVLFSSLQLSALSGFVVLAAPLSARAADGDVQSVEAAATEAIKAGRLDDAIGKLKSGIARLEEFPRGYYLLGYANRKKEQWLDAAVAYRSYIALRPNEPDAYFGLGKALAGLGDNKPAAAALRTY